MSYRSCGGPSEIVGCIIGLLGLLVPAWAEDFTHRYPASLDYSQPLRGYDWESGEGDVWRCREFRFSVADEFSVETGSSQVVFGRHGTNVLWAVVLPEMPGKILKAKAGEGELVTSIWLRFHPQRVAELFPSSTVTGAGEAGRIAEAKRIAAHKLRFSWQASGKPAVPSRSSLVLDLETESGSRRFFSIDSARKTVEYIDQFRKLSLPVSAPLNPGDGARIFDTVWNAFDREYAMFVVKPHVQWNALRDVHRPKAVAAKTRDELAFVLVQLLNHLEDLHVFVAVEERYLPGYTRERPLNANADAIPHLIGELIPAGRDLSWAKTKDGIGYINLDGLRDQKTPELFLQVLQDMAHTRGLILDLRFNGGGSELLAQQMVGCFLDREQVYAKNRSRSGPQHGDLGPISARRIQPHPRWHYTGPVVALQGQRTMSSAEAMVLMLQQCPNVTTWGDRTAGSSGNPRQVEAGLGIVVNLPRWIPMDAEGKSFDTVGVQPAVRLPSHPADFTGTSDPVLSAALARLREQPEPAEVLQARVDVKQP